MKILAEYKGYCLLERYGRPYIRFWGGRDEDMPCEFPVTEEDVQRAMAAPEVIRSLVQKFKSHAEWDAETFFRLGIVEYLLRQSKLSQVWAERTYAKLVRHTDIRNEFYGYIMEESFPQRALSVEGFTAEYLVHNYPLSPLGAYNYLVYLREMPNKALADLKAGLPSKDFVQCEAGPGRG